MHYNTYQIVETEKKLQICLKSASISNRSVYITTVTFAWLIIIKFINQLKQYQISLTREIKFTLHKESQSHLFFIRTYGGSAFCEPINKSLDRTVRYSRRFLVFFRFFFHCLGRFVNIR